MGYTAGDGGGVLVLLFLPSLPPRARHRVRRSRDLLPTYFLASNNLICAAGGLAAVCGRKRETRRRCAVAAIPKQAGGLSRRSLQVYVSGGPFMSKGKQA